MICCPEAWFEWNESDLSQFDTKVQGSAVTSSTISVVTKAGVNWIKFEVTSNSGDGNTTGVILPITATPPTDNYAITADFINTTTGSSNSVGAGVIARFVISGSSSYYLARFVDRDDSQRLNRYNSGTQAQLGLDSSDPNLNGTNQGTRLMLSVLGTSEVLVSRVVGEQFLYLDESGNQLTSRGQAGLYSSTSGVATSTANLFRNIRCYSLEDLC